MVAGRGSRRFLRGVGMEIKKHEILSFFYES